MKCNHERLNQIKNDVLECDCGKQWLKTSNENTLYGIWMSPTIEIKPKAHCPLCDIDFDAEGNKCPSCEQNIEDYHK